VNVTDLKPGDRVRQPSGTELTVSRIDQGFMGRPEMYALIEDTPDRWLKAPVRSDAQVEVYSED